MSKALRLAALALLVAGPLAAQERTLDQVLAEHYKNIGGLDKWKSLSTVKFTGKMATQGMEMPVTMLAKQGKSRVDFVFQGMTGTQAYDGETAWMVMPFMGKTEPEAMPADQAKDMAEQADLAGPLVDYAVKGHKVELAGRQPVEGTDAYKLTVTLKSGDLRHIYLDAEQFIPIRAEGKRKVQGMEVEFETTMSDYRDVGGLLFPHVIESKIRGMPAGQTITIEKIEINVPIDDASFVMPKKG